MVAERKPYGPLMHVVRRSELTGILPGPASHGSLAISSKESHMTEQDPQFQSAAPAPSNGLAIGSLVLGILSIVTAIIPFVGIVAWVLAPIGLILGFLARKKPGGQGLAIAGIVTSGIGLVICILWVVGFGALIAGNAGSF